MYPYRIIDETTWARAVHCAVFRNYAEPNYCVTFELDVTKFLAYVRAEKLSFTAAMGYAATACANRIEAFRYRFMDGKVVLFDRIDTSFTWLGRDEELFKVITVPFSGRLSEFCASVVRTAQTQKEYFQGALGIDVFQCSALPWISYTHISHTISGRKDVSTPLFDWGKYEKRGEKIIMPFSVQAHHSFVDGVHIGRFYTALQAFCNEIGGDNDAQT